MGTIYTRAEQVHFANFTEHREIVGPFLSCFDVTRAFWRIKGERDRIACFYLKPETFIAELIGLERELLMVYAPFSQFQARTIKLHDEVLTLDRTRLDPLASIIISDDPETHQAVREYLVTDLERPPIVALSSDELAELTDANSIRELFIREIFQRDIFALESPLKSDTTFFGRQDIVTELFDRYRAGQNSGLFGLRRIGKTSVLYALRRRCTTSEIAGTSYLDVSNPTLYQARWWELLQFVAKSFTVDLGLQRAQRSRVRCLTVTYTQKDAAGHFKADVTEIAQYLPGVRLLLLLDEIEYLTFDISPAGHWEREFLPFWQTLRSVHQDTEGQFGFIVAGVNPRILEADRVGAVDNPLFATTRPFFLGPFDVSTSRQMVRKLSRYMGLRCEEDLYRRLHHEYGGHPFLVRQACSALASRVRDRPGDLSVALFEKEKEGIAVSLERIIRQILNVLATWYPDEFEMLQMLAQGDRVTFLEYANGSASFTQHVEGYGLVRGARNNPKMVIGLVREVLAKVPSRAADGEADPGDEDGVLAEISRRRNAIEQGLRKLLKIGLTIASGRNKARINLDKSLTEDRRAVLSQYSYDDIWEQLYFNELAGILNQNWAAFQKVFAKEKAMVLRWMEHINRCRADAHARTLSEEDLAYLRICFRRLEEILEL